MLIFIPEKQQLSVAIPEAVASPIVPPPQVTAPTVPISTVSPAPVPTLPTPTPTVAPPSPSVPISPVPSPSLASPVVHVPLSVATRSISSPTTASAASALLSPVVAMGISPKRSPKVRKIPPFSMGSLHQAYWIGRRGANSTKGVSCHFYFQFVGHWNLEKLQTALNSVIIRHAALRTIVLPEGLFKILENVPPYTISIEDFSSLSEKESRAGVEKTRERMSHQAFDTTSWPLFEVRVSAVSESKHVLHVDFDHIILDMKG